MSDVRTHLDRALADLRDVLASGGDVDEFAFNLELRLALSQALGLSWAAHPDGTNPVRRFSVPGAGPGMEVTVGRQPNRPSA